MKRILFAGAALAAMTYGAMAADVSYNPITAPPAMQMVAGDIALYTGFSGIDFGSGDNYNGSVLGGYARGNVFLTPNLTLQLDLNAENNFEGDGDNSYSIVNGAAHLSHRTPGMLLGGFVSLGYNGWVGERFATLGLDAQTYVGPFQVYGQLGYTTGMGFSGRAFYGHAVARYFVTQNIMLSGNLGLASLWSSGGGDSATAIRWGLDAEIKGQNSPFGAFLSYQGANTSLPYSGPNITEATFLIGGKLHFNNRSLQSAAQAGATLFDYNPATGVNHLRWLGY